MKKSMAASLGLVSVMVLAMGVSSARAVGTNWYVAASGSGSDGQTWATAFTNIQAAVNAAVNNDNIFVKTGRYVTSSTIVISNKVLTLRGGYAGATPEPGAFSTDPTLTVADANVSAANGTQRSVFLLTACKDGLLENITLTKGNAATLGGGAYLKGTTNTLRNCLIASNFMDSAGGGGIAMDGGQASLDHCTICLASTSSFGSDPGGGIYLSGGSLTATTCAIYGNQSQVLGGAGIYVTGGTGRFFNCLIRDNTETVSNRLVAGGIQVVGGAASFENCTIFGNSPIGVAQTGGVATVTDSIIWNNGDDVAGAVTLANCNIEDGDNQGINGCMSANPQLVDGYYLGSGSLCINAGGDTAANVGLAGAYAQTAVTDSGTVDLGYHYDAAFSATDVYVATNGNNAWAGTVGSPFKTITYALSVAAPNTRIHVAAGTYNTNSLEVFPLVLATDGVQVLGANAALTVVNATGSGKQVMAVTGVGQGSVLSNLTFRGASMGTSGGSGGGLLLTSTGVRVVDCIIWGNKVSFFGGGVYLDGGTPLLQGCSLRGNTAGNNSGGGIYMVSGSLNLQSCTMVTNSASGSTPPRGQGGAIYDKSVGTLNVFNSLIVSNIAEGTNTRHNRQNVVPAHANDA